MNWLTVAKVAALGTVLFSAWITLIWRGVPKVGKVSPGIVLEVPNSPGQIYAVLGDPSETSAIRTVAAHAQYVDYALIPCYVLLFVPVGYLQFSWKWPGVLCSFLALVAGFCDYREDFGILDGITALNNHQVPDPSLAAMWSWPKWSLLFVILLIQAWVLMNREASRLPLRFPFTHWIGVALGVGIIALALVGLFGCARQDRDMLSLGALSVASIPLWFLVVGGVELV